MEFLSRSIALILIAVFLPLFFIIAFFSILLQGFPVLFRQERIGKIFHPFTLYKFRTMRNKDGKKITIASDKRITAWGSVLRKTKLDELPQLFNILGGDMRFIGPRPEIKEYVGPESFSFLNNFKPGLSDYGSILFRNEAEILAGSVKENPYNQVLGIKLELANYYLARKGFLEDLKLVTLTLISIIFDQWTSRYVYKSILSKTARELYDNL